MYGTGYVLYLAQFATYAPTVSSKRGPLANAGSGYLTVTVAVPLLGR